MRNENFIDRWFKRDRRRTEAEARLLRIKENRQAELEPQEPPRECDGTCYSEPLNR